jgi:hypothetical protein
MGHDDCRAATLLLEEEYRTKLVLFELVDNQLQEEQIDLASSFVVFDMLFARGDGLFSICRPGSGKSIYRHV